MDGTTTSRSAAKPREKPSDHQKAELFTEDPKSATAPLSAVIKSVNPAESTKGAIYRLKDDHDRAPEFSHLVAEAAVEKQQPDVMLAPGRKAAPAL